jgi:hypothetical protein
LHQEASAASTDPEKKILECIDQGIDTFGESVKTVVYWRFKTVYNSERKDVPRRPDLFSESLRAFFGERSFYVERSIVSVLIDTFHLEDVEISDSLTRAITTARRKERSDST